MQVLAQFFNNGVKRKGGQLIVRTTKYTEHDYSDDDDHDDDDDDGEVDDYVDHIRWSDHESTVNTE